MPKPILIVLLILSLFCSAGAQDLYDVGTIHTIQIVFPQSNWDQLLDNLYAAGEDRLLGTVTIDGILYDSVGVRYKGNSTYSPSRTKNPFNIKLDHIINDQTHQGYGTLKLANVWFDPSFVREVLGYEIARKYMAASQSSYANVYVNGTLMGLYTSVQDVDKLFTRTHYQSDEGARIKGDMDGPPQGWVIWGYEGQDSTSYMDTYELDSDHGWPDLIDFLDTLNNYTAAVESVLDVDRHLWMLAYDNLLVNLDAPINFGHNFYLYRDDAYQFNPIIWDLNMCFGGFTSIIGGGNLNVTQMQQLNPFLNESHANYPIVNKFLQNATYRKMYIAHMKTLVVENFSNGWYSTRATELQSIITAAVQADPNKPYTFSNFTANLNTQVGQTPGITQLMNARATYINNHASFQAAGPAITLVTYSPAVVAANASVTVVATVGSATSVKVGYRDNTAMPFVKVTMLDDGTHGDGAAGDGVYGATIPTTNSDIHYYIYAENASAASFLPVRAEFEDSLIAVTAPSGTGIVINEFQADNATTATDQDGEYEDWVELYNTTASPVSLSGFHLSDKVDNVGKWTFPDTTIGVGEHLVVWADEDGSQVGLHANFKLSTGGEAVVFSNPDLTVIDQIVFGAQTTDMTTSRCPDGTGEFIETQPSIGAANSCSSYICGDADGSGVVTISDAVYLISHIFGGGPAPDPLLSGDVNCSGGVTISDAVYLIAYIFGGGAVPCADCP